MTQEEKENISISVTYVDSKFYSHMGTKGWFTEIRDESTIYSDSLVEAVKLFDTPKEAFEWGLKSYKELKC